MASIKDVSWGRRVDRSDKSDTRFLYDQRYAFRVAAGLERLAARGCRDTLDSRPLDDIAERIREGAASSTTIYSMGSNSALGRAKAVLKSAGKRDGRVVCTGVQRALPIYAQYGKRKLKGKPFAKKRRATTKKRGKP